MTTTPAAVGEETPTLDALIHMDDFGKEYISDVGAVRRALTAARAEAEALRKLLTECRENLCRIGGDYASAYEHGDRLSMKRSDEERDELYSRVDAALAARRER